MFLKILFLLAAGVVAIALHGAATITSDGLEIDLDHGNLESASAIEELRAIDRQISTLFKVSGKRSPLRCRVLLTDKLPQGELKADFTPREWVLSFNDSSQAWRDDFQLRRRLFGLILLAKTPGAKIPPSLDYLPGWVVAGIDSKLKSAGSSELIVHRNCYLPILRALSELGKFPDFRQMRRLTPELLTPPAMEFYRELGRVMLEYGSALSSSTDNALLDYCLLSAHLGAIEEQNFQSTLGRLILKNSPDSGQPNNERIQRAFERYAESIAFNEFFPRPAYIIQEKFQEAMKFKLPTLDAKGQLTGESVLCDLSRLPEILPGRPDGGQLREMLKNQLLALRRGSPPEFSRELILLVEEIYRLPIVESSGSTEKFRQKIALISDQIARRTEIEKFLFATETELLPTRQLYGIAIQTTEKPSPALSKSAQKFFEQVESEWLDD
ncbi:MAG: hypothetical protein LBM70_00975 [Victivallales bacterium]|jgi:hypothetical protein|nr:hypothetical protein [Victivallales bacterium]